MATFYLDLEGGNDANNGLSFANRWKTFGSGATAARIAPGDTIRVMASPDPTSIGSATWNGAGRQAALSISSSTNATPIVVTTSANHGLVTGDYVSIIGHTTNTNANGIWKVGTTTSTTFQLLQLSGANTTGNGAGGATGSVTKYNNQMVELATPVNQNIALCGGLGQKPAWTASTNVGTAQETTDYKEGYSCARIAVAGAFTTGKAAYYTLPATLDLSAYQQVSFWLKVTGTLGAAGQAYIGLCTDTIGATVVHTCNIPALGASGLWVPVTVNLGTNLNAAIRSVALYIVTDVGSQTFYIDNIVACKAASSADSLNMTSLISKNGADDEWFAIQSINFDTIQICTLQSGLPDAVGQRGYYGTSETVTTYKRETIKTTPAAGAATIVNDFTENGTATSLITYSGGWNRTDMSTQTGETWVDGQNGLGRAFQGTTAVTYNRTDKLNAVRYNFGWSLLGIGCQCASGRFTTNSAGGMGAGNDCFLEGPIWANNNASAGITLQNNLGVSVGTIKSANNNQSQGIIPGSYTTITTIESASNNGSAGITILTAGYVRVGSLTANYNVNAISASSGVDVYVNGGSSSSNTTSSVSVGTGRLYLNNFTINEVTEVSGIAGSGTLFSARHDNTDGNNWQWQATGTINQQTSVVDSPATTSWKMNPTNSSTSSTYPVILKIARIACNANSLVTVTARMRRDNTGLTMRLVCPGGQIAGVSSDVFSDMTAAANTWETVTITFTPTKAGGVEIFAYAFGGTTFSGYVCNVTATQA